MNAILAKLIRSRSPKGTGVSLKVSLLTLLLALLPTHHTVANDQANVQAHELQAFLKQQGELHQQIVNSLSANKRFSLSTLEQELQSFMPQAQTQQAKDLLQAGQQVVITNYLSTSAMKTLHTKHQAQSTQPQKLIDIFNAKVKSLDTQYDASTTDKATLEKLAKALMEEFAHHDYSSVGYNDQDQAKWLHYFYTYFELDAKVKSLKRACDLPTKAQHAFLKEPILNVENSDTKNNSDNNNSDNELSENSTKKPFYLAEEATQQYRAIHQLVTQYSEMLFSNIEAINCTALWDHIIEMDKTLADLKNLTHDKLYEDYFTTSFTQTMVLSELDDM